MEGSRQRRPARDAQLLATLAETLNPKRAPFYVTGANSGHPDGWYWQLPQHQRPEWLGRNVYFAERRILQELQGDRAAAV